MKTNKTPKCYWCDRPATRIDYDNNHGVVSKIISCDECFRLPRGFKLARKINPRPDGISQLDRKIEIWSISYKHVWYEVWVEALEERTISQVFAEYGEVTDEVLAYLESEIKKIDN